MAEQLDLLGNDRIVSTALHQEMQRSYLEYAMSVIVGRALPDVRDGLKPVQRRILYAMHELGLTPDRPYRKCARVVGDVLGKYHPHGDQSVYDALVRQVQDFTCRYPLLDGHGNFGSVDNDPPAAMRYTETRLAPISHEALLGEIGDDTVDFVGNFDNSQEEPIVLPAQLPFLLLNGCSGIAVGMATNIPPHNLGEILDGLVALIDRPDLSDEALRKLIPGPDFPTGGEILGTAGIEDAYRHGKGSIPLRGVVSLEEVQPGRGRHRRSALVITELPYQVNKSAWIEKVADLTNQNKLDGIADIRDESDREGMRVVIELKREANPAQILQQLYQKTSLQTTFGAIFLALVNGEPRQQSLRELLQEFLQFRENTLIRRYRHQLHQWEQRLELVLGLRIALDNLDRLVDLLRHAPDGSTAKAHLQVHLDLSDRQADAILAMPMRRITSTEQQALMEEVATLQAQIQQLACLLNDRQALLQGLKKDLRRLKRKYSNPRRTRILSPETLTEVDESLTSPVLLEEPEEETVLELTQRGYGRRLTLRSAQRQSSSTLDNTWQEASTVEDFPLVTQRIQGDRELLVISRHAKAYTLKTSDLPLQRRSGKGVPLVTLLPEEFHGNPQHLIWCQPLPDNPEAWDLIALSRGAKVKRLPLADFQNLTQRGLILMKLREEDDLFWIGLAPPDHQLVVATDRGRLLRFPINDEQLPIQGRNTQGQTVLRLRKQEQLVGAALVQTHHHLLCLSQKGYGKAMAVTALPLGCRGDLGNTAFQFVLKTDGLVSLHQRQERSSLILMSESASGTHWARLSPDEFPEQGRISGGAQLIKLRRDERISQVLPQSHHLDSLTDP